MCISNYHRQRLGRAEYGGTVLSASQTFLPPSAKPAAPYEQVMTSLLIL
jgi:hypothetical protein